MRCFRLTLLGFALLLGACGGDDADTDDVAAQAERPASSDFCENARRYTEKFEDVAASFGDPDESRRRFEEFEVAIEDIADDAPAEVEADVADVVRNFKDVKALFEKYDYEFSKIPPEESDALDDEDTQAANDRVNAYMEEVCGIDANKDGDAG